MAYLFLLIRHYVLQNLAKDLFSFLIETEAGS